MNENVLKLALQCGVVDFTTAGGTTAPQYFVPNSVSITDINHFASLIVVECANIALNTYINDSPGGCATRPIRKHFGVE